MWEISKEKSANFRLDGHFWTMTILDFANIQKFLASNRSDSDNLKGFPLYKKYGFV